MNNFAKSLLRTTSGGALLLAAALATPGLVHAQTAPAPAAGSTATEVDELVVVGSRIRRDNFTTPSPIQVINREESLLAGLASTTDTLQSTSVTQGNAQINNAFGGFVTNGGPGANTLGLRGLGATRTLILLNGRRIAPAGTRGGVGSADLNVLPTGIVERYEILKDGASSIYGSDAVAGVVNIITRRNMNGFNVEAQANVPEHGGAEEYRFSVTAGHTGSRYQVAGSFDWYRRTNLTLADRDWTLCNTDFRHVPGSPNTLTDFIDPITGQPKCYPITGTGSNGVTINTIGTNSRSGIGAAGTLAPGALASFNRWRPNAAITTGLIGYEGVGGAGAGNSVGPRDTFEPRMLNRSLISPVDTYNVYLQGSYDLQALGGRELYAEVLGSRRESSQVGYRQLSLDYATRVADLNGVLGPNPLVPAFLQNSVVQSAPTAITNGQGLGVRAFIGFGNDQSSQTVDFWRGTIGMHGDFAIPRWRYDGYFSYSIADASYTGQSWLTDRMAQTLDVVVAPSNVSATVVRNGLTCRVNVTAPNTGCIPAPALTAATVGGILPADWIDYTFRNVTGSTRYTEYVASLGLDGPVFHMPAGDVKAALGFEYRFARINDTPPLDSQTGNLYNLSSAAITRGRDHVWEAYGELEIPLLANQPLAKSLTLNVSGRYTNYASYGSDTTYKDGGAWSPTGWMTVRATYGTSFRAPALFEQFQGGTSGFLSSTTDPCNNYGANPGTARFTNCNAELNNPAFTATSSVQVITAGGAAQGLAAETSTNFTAGVIFQPHLPTWAGQFSLAVDYYEIEVDNSVSRVGASNLLAFCYDDPQFRAGGGYCNFIAPRTPGSNALTVFDSYTNVATDRVTGIDYNFRYLRDVGPGTLRLNGLVTQYLHQQNRLFSTDPLDENNGTLTNPAWTATLDATYTLHEWKVRYGLEWIQGTDSYELLFGPGVTANDVGFTFDVPDYYLHNLSVQYKSTRNWQVTAGVHNLTDEVPPSVSSGAYNRVGNALLYSGFDYVGRTWFINASRSF